MKASKSFPEIRTLGEKERSRTNHKLFRNMRKAIARWGIKEKTHQKQQGICFYCKHATPLIAWSVDHKIPIAKGGTNAKINLIGCCMSCNGAKGDKI